MEWQIIRMDDLLASHVWEPQPTNQMVQEDGNRLDSCPWNRFHDTTCISSGESMQEEQSIGIYYILKCKKYCILIRPCPPTKPLGAIKRIHRVHPTSTPYPTSWCSGVVGFLWAIERRLCLIEYNFRAKFGRQGGLIPWPNHDGRAKLDRLSRPKKSTIP